jgi:hypothetical protein
MSANGEDIRAVREFMEHLSGKHIELAAVDPERGTYALSHTEIDNIVLESFGIDLAKLEAERRDMIDKLAATGR